MDEDLGEADWDLPEGEEEELHEVDPVLCLASPEK